MLVSLGFFILITNTWALSERRDLRWNVDEDRQSATGTLAVTKNEEWGFEAGAQVIISIEVRPIGGKYTLNNDVLFLRMFTSSQWAAMHTTEYLPNDLMCLEPGIIRREIRNRLTLYNTTLPRSGNFVLAIQLCTPYPVTVTVDTVFWNPIGSHLSLQQQPLIDVYTAFMMLYGFVLWQWTIMLIQSRHHIVKVHWFILGLAVLKLIEMTSLYVHLGILRRQGNVSPQLEFYVRSISSISETAIMGVEWMICMTWTIYRQTFTHHECYVSGLAGFSFLIFRTMYTFCIDSDSSTLCSVYMITFYVIKFLIEWGLLVALQQNISRLKIEVFEDDTATTDSLPLLRRLTQIKNVYAIAKLTPFVLVFIRFSILTWKNQWVTTVMEQGIVWLQFLFFGAILRPNP